MCVCVGGGGFGNWDLTFFMGLMKIKKKGMCPTLPLYHTKSSQMRNMTFLKGGHDPLYPTSQIIGIAIAIARHDSCQLCEIVRSIKSIWSKTQNYEISHHHPSLHCWVRFNFQQLFWSRPVLAPNSKLIKTFQNIGISESTVLAFLNNNARMEV